MPSSASGRLGWAGLATILVAGSLLAFAFADNRWALDWQPAWAAREPWRAWTAAFVHYSERHLGANVAGAALVGAFGVVAFVPLRSVVAWLVAWPLTQIGLVARSDLLHYGGLSGVLHAGVAVVALHLIVAGRGRRRWIGAATLAVVAVKVIGEAPWGAALRHPAGWDIAVAPFAHATGVVAGLLASAVGEMLQRRFGVRAQTAVSEALASSR